MIETIAHPTDFSEASERAFAHALCLALAAKARLLPVARQGWRGRRLGVLSPRARDVGPLGLTGCRRAHAEIATKLGIIARHTRVPSLFIGPKANGDGDAMSGAMRLNRVLLPLAHKPSPRHAFRMLSEMLTCIGAPPSALRLLHAGETAPLVIAPAGAQSPPVELATGPVVDTILGAAERSLADLIAMPTAGRQGIFDALNGSTTEQVLRHAPCPLLTLHASSSASG